MDLVTPAPPPLEALLFACRLEETREQIEARWPHPDAWQWDDAKSTLRWRSPPAPLDRCAIGYEMPRGKLRALRLTVFERGDYATLEKLDAQLRAWLPSFPLLSSGGRPWSAAEERPRLEGKGTPTMRVARPIESDLGPRGWLFGQAFAVKPKGEQAYGFELGFHPGGRPGRG